MKDVKAIEPLTTAELEEVRQHVIHKLAMRPVFALVGGGEDVETMARLIATIDATNYALRLLQDNWPRSVPWPPTRREEG